MINKSVYIVAASLFAGGFSLSAAAECCSVEHAASVQKAAASAERTFSDSELFTILGQFMAFSGGVFDLKLSGKELEAFAEGLAQPLVDGDVFADVEDAKIEAAVAEAVARLDQLEAGEEAKPLSEEATRYLGYVVALQSGIVGLGLSPEEGEAVRLGAVAGAGLQEPTDEMQSAMQQLSTLMDARIQVLMPEQAASAGDGRSPEEHKADGETFLKALTETEAAVQKTDSGLYFLILEEGTGDKPSATDSVRVHYHGTLIDGTVFDSSVERGQPVDFPLQGVVPGFSEGLQQVAEGGKVRLFIPSHLAYGEQARPGSPIPGGALIMFDCELIAVNP